MVSNSEFRRQGLGFRVHGSRFRVYARTRFRVYGLRFKVEGFSGFMV
jgi:hypothetical protein